MRRRNRSWLDDLLCDVQDMIRDRYRYERECAYSPDDEYCEPIEVAFGDELVIGQ